MEPPAQTQTFLAEREELIYHLGTMSANRSPVLVDAFLAALASLGMSVAQLEVYRPAGLKGSRCLGFIAGKHQSFGIGNRPDVVATKGLVIHVELVDGQTWQVSALDGIPRAMVGKKKLAHCPNLAELVKLLFNVVADGMTRVRSDVLEWLDVEEIDDPNFNLFVAAAVQYGLEPKLRWRRDDSFGCVTGFGPWRKVLLLRKKRDGSLDLEVSEDWKAS